MSDTNMSEYTITVKFLMNHKHIILLRKLSTRVYINKICTTIAKTHRYKIPVKHKYSISCKNTERPIKRNAQRKYIAYKTNNSNNAV